MIHPGSVFAPGTALRGADDALGRAPIGIVPIIWNNADLPDLAPPVPADHVLDEIARLGFEGTQTGTGYPSGAALVEALRARDLRLAEVYAALPFSANGPAGDALAVGRTKLAELHAADGDVLVAALGLSPGRIERAGRAEVSDTPRLTDDAWAALVEILDTLGREARAQGHRVAFHQHAGTFVETPDELDRLVDRTNADLVGICLDVGHYTVGGGDPVAALRRYGERVTHVHLKDVAAGPLARLRAGELGGFLDALRARIFTELGGGLLDVPGVLAQLDRRDYAGWLMSEQDTTWNPSSESAAASRRVLAYALRTLPGGQR